jgi:hypothetical protein
MMEAVSDVQNLDVGYLVVGGEALHAERLESWRRNPSIVKIVNEYGPTEATVGCCSYDLGRGAPPTGAVPIGRPIWNTRLYVLDPHFEPLPAGLVGELYVGGEGLARGYLNRAGLTAGRFVPDPFGRDSGSRLYRTGDLARFREDGVIEYVGRRDDQVQVRGHRIELGEIEAAMLDHEDVREAVVVVRHDNVGTSRLTGYVVMNLDRDVDATELRRHLEARLPKYMVPTMFIAIDHLPRVQSGKLDRGALPTPPQVRPDLGKGFVAPTTPVEELLAVIWGEVLQVDRVGVEDNFFDLGGHSLLAVQVISRIRHILRMDVPVRQLFENPTISSLSRALVLNVPATAHFNKVGELLKKVRSMSADEKEAMLQQHGHDRSSSPHLEGP